jgi:tetratricopeptide (TPR) repeat protein
LNVAAPGQIVVSRYTQHLRDGYFRFEDLGEFELKGKTHPVRAYALVEEVHGHTRLEVSKSRGLTALVGRGRELRRLGEAWASAREGRGTIVLISGDPGLGKSRLLYEFVRGVPEAEIVEASCVSYGGSIPHHLVLSALRRVFELSDHMSEEEVRARLQSRLATLGLTAPYALDLLGHFLGIAVPPATLARLPGAQLKEQTLGLLRSIFVKAAARRPLLVVLENLHWIDASSAEFLRLLAADVPGHRLLLLLTTRPWPSAHELPTAHDTLRLGGLDEEDRERMVLDLLQTESASPELLRLILSKTDGNPLYVEEVVRQLRETGGLVIEAEHATLRTANVQVPATIHDIIAARVDRLAEHLKQALQGAAVIGRQFGVSLLTRTLAVNGELPGRLESLSGLDFIYQTALEPDPTYNFKHALTQDVVYGGLLVRRRRVYHGAAGTGLEELFGARLDDVVELLAYHFARSDDSERAVDYAIQAGEKAQRRWANREALAHFQGALSLLDGMPDTTANRLRRIDAVVKQAEIKFALGEHAEHLKALESIQALVAACGDAPRQAAWHYWSGFLHSLIGSRPDVAITYCRQAAAIAETCGLAELRAYAESCLAQAYLFAGDLRGAMEVGHRALATFEAQGNVWWTCRTLIHLAPCANALGRWADSLAYCRRILDHGLAVDDLRLKAAGWWRTASAHLYRGSPAEALQCCDEALKLSPTPFDGTMLKAMQAYAVVKNGAPASGIPPLSEAVAWLQQAHLPYTRSVIALWLADAHLRNGEPGRAREISEEVLAVTRTSGYRHLEGVALRVLGEALVTADPGAARAHLETAQSVLEELGARNDVARTLMARAVLEREDADTIAARRHLEEAISLFEELGTLDEPIRARALLDTLPAG